MKSHKAFGDAFEHLFYLGCQLTRVQDERLYPDERIYRALYIPSFHPTHIINVRLLGDMAELTYYVRDYHAEKEMLLPSDGTYWQWFMSVIDAFDNGTEVSNQLPQYYCFFREQRELTPTQLTWFTTEIDNLNPLSINSSPDPDQFNYRDGEMRRGIVRFNGGDTHTFDLRPMDDWQAHADQLAYYLLMYKLAASVCIDEFSLANLLEVQYCFFGSKAIASNAFFFEPIR